MKKIKKIIFADNAMKDIPEDQREEIVSEIERMFKENDPAEIGRPIEHLTPGASECPHCKSALIQGPVLKIPKQDGTVAVKQIYDCNGCGLPFIGNEVN